MRSSPDAAARPQQQAAGRSARWRQIVFLLALLLAGGAISFLVVRYIDPPKISTATPAPAPVKRTGALPA